MKPLDTATPAAHAGHDPSLVAAYAAGDAAGRELAEARALVSGCAGCAELHRDLRAIAAALPAVPAPARPASRDFRITPEQAAALRPSRARGALARLLAPLASARFAFAGPAGAGLAALGLAGVLLSGGLGQPVGQTALSAPIANSGAGGVPSPAFALASPMPTADTIGVIGQAGQPGSPRIEGTTTNPGVDASPLAMVTGPSTASGPKQAGPSDNASRATPDAVVAAAPTLDAAPRAPMTSAPPAGIPPVTLVGALLIAVGFVIGGLRVLARLTA